jgi:hypothetical protein
MKKIKWLLVIFIIINFYECKKDAGNTDNYFISASLNNKEQKFSDNPETSEMWLESINSFSMFANNEKANKEFSLGIVHSFNSTIKEGVYKDNSGIHYKMGNTLYGSAYDPNPSSVQITISAFTKQYIKGSFSGTLYRQDNLNDSIVVTNGEFYMPPLLR